MTRLCEICGQPIHPERLEALPDTTRCTEHSQTAKLIGFNVYSFSKGTAPELITIKPSDTEAVRRAKRANGRRR